ncbi:Uncharacterised protein [Mycobacterium tuberculosis]|nr:Uncharacterised protein [Mycobacterium tuberculosis]
MNEQKLWQLTEFAKEVGPHYTTINNWFKSLEQQRIHYVNRLKNDQRIYDELDLKIGQFITEKKSKGWALDGIFNELKDNPPFLLRPFPEEFKDSGELSLETALADVKRGLQQEFERLLAEHSKNQTALLQEVNESNKAVTRQQRITDMITHNRIRSELEIEALDEWSKQPATVRLIKTGIFRKEEDTTKKEKFIIQYVKDNYEDRLKKQFNE